MLLAPTAAQSAATAAGRPLLACYLPTFDRRSRRPIPRLGAPNPNPNPNPNCGLAPAGEADEAPILLTLGQCSRVLKKTMAHPKATDFLHPVDWKRCSRRRPNLSCFSSSPPSLPPAPLSVPH